MEPWSCWTKLESLEGFYKTKKIGRNWVWEELNFAMLRFPQWDILPQSDFKEEDSNSTRHRWSRRRSGCERSGKMSGQVISIWVTRGFYVEEKGSLRKSGVGDRTDSRWWSGKKEVDPSTITEMNRAEREKKKDRREESERCEQKREEEVGDETSWAAPLSEASEISEAATRGGRPRPSHRGWSQIS